MPRFHLSEILDKVLLLLAMLVFLWVGMSAIRGARELDTIAGSERPLISETLRNAPRVEVPDPRMAIDGWNEPSSQTRGKDWVFDVFTPPVIYYDSMAQTFAVTPPTLRGPETDTGAWARFEVELIEVRMRPYRFQLVGYSGEPGNYVAYLESAETGALHLLREGAEVPSAEARLLSFQEQQIAIAGEDSMPVVQTVGIARLLDARLGRELSLTNLETKMFPDLEARVRDLRNGAVHLVTTGSRLAVEDSDYVIGDLSADPEAARVTKMSKDGERSYSKVLTPIARPSSRPSGSQELSSDNPFAIRPKRPETKPQG